MNHRLEFDPLEDRALPSTLSINNVFVTEGNSGTTDAIFTVFLSEATTQTVTVDYFTADSTASAGFDYQAKSGTLTFDPGDTSKTISISVIGDTVDEFDEEFHVNLSNAVNATISDNQGTGTIRDDDSSVTPAITINNAFVSEGNTGTTNATFTVSLSQASSKVVTVNFDTTDNTASSPSDYVATSGTLTFNVGDTSKTINVLVNGDTVDEEDEKFLVNLSSPSNATIDDGQGEGTIRDDDSGTPPSITINNAAVREGTSGTTDAIFSVFLSEASGTTVTVDFATSNETASAPSDYVATSGTLTFAAGETTKTIAVPVNGDTIDENDETFRLTLSNATNAIIADNQGTGTILDDDPATVLSASITDATVTEGDSGVVNAIFTVTMSGTSTDTVTVRFNTVDRTANSGSDYQSQSGTLTFTPGETTKTISVPVIGDTISEPTETFAVQLTNPLNVTISDSEGVGTIIDNDSNPGVSINDVSVTEGDSGSSANAVFTVSLSAQSSQTVTVDFSTADGTATAPGDYTSTSGRLVFNPGDTTATISVPVIGDNSDESDETFLVKLTAATHASISDAQGTGTIRDDDGTTTPPPGGTPTAAISNVAVTEGNSGTTNAVFTVTLSAASDQTVTLHFATADGTASSANDYVARSGTLTFQPGDTAETIAVQVNGDTTAESNENFFVNLTDPSNVTIDDSQGVGTILDDDSSGGPGGGSPSIFINDATLTEGNSGTMNLIFTIRLSASSASKVTVDVATADGSAQAPSDYETRSGRITFSPGETTKTLSVPIHGDQIDEPNEVFFVNLSNANNATIGDNQAVGTIIDDDPSTQPPSSISVGDVRVLEGNSGDTTASFRVVLSSVSSQTVTVDFSTEDGSATAGDDYGARSGQLTFVPGDTVEIIDIPVHGDAVNETDETFFVNLSNATNASIVDGQASGVIVNDDSGGNPQLTINNVTITEGDAGTATALFTWDPLESTCRHASLSIL